MNFNRKRVDERSIDEMIGLCKGLIADSDVSQPEAIFLQEWMEANVPCSEDPMVNQIYRRVHEMLIDGILDSKEKAELLSLLRMFTGLESPGEIVQNMASTLPLNDPLPEVELEGRSFCLTGKFIYGPRRICEQVIKDRGGIISKGVTLKTDYLAIGILGTTDWIHSTHGRKIEKAMEYRERTGSLAIISEDHWARHAFRT